MRTICMVLLSGFAFFSCSSSEIDTIEDTDLQFASQKWELVRMSGSFVNSETTGDEMEWQEYYVFNLDGSFFRSRNRDGGTIEAKGIYETVEYDNDDMDYLELTYESGQELIGGCNGDGTEVLAYRSQKDLSNTWMICDGPGLDYKLSED